jgi:hypothetical protein
VGHDWRSADDQKAVITRLGEQSGLRVTLHHKDVPHGRYLAIKFKDGSGAAIVLDQGFGAWTVPRHVSVRHDFGADVATQAKKLMSINAVLERRGIGKTYIIASSL